MIYATFLSQIRIFNGECYIPCDVRDEMQITALVEQVLKKYGRIDILVNNAAVAIFKPMEEHSAADWQTIMDVNAKGPFLLSRAVIPVMKKQDSGKIIFIASNITHQGFGLLSAYAASKGALIALTKTMAVELAKYGINVNAISPGSTDTLQNERFLTDPAFIASLKEKTATGKPMQPADIAGSAVFLASDFSNAIHGQNILVDNSYSNPPMEIGS